MVLWNNTGVRHFRQVIWRWRRLSGTSTCGHIGPCVPAGYLAKPGTLYRLGQRIATYLPACPCQPVPARAWSYLPACPCQHTRWSFKMTRFVLRPLRYHMLLRLQTDPLCAGARAPPASLVLLTTVVPPPRRGYLPAHFFRWSPTRQVPGPDVPTRQGAQGEQRPSQEHLLPRRVTVHNKSFYRPCSCGAARCPHRQSGAPPRQGGTCCSWHAFCTCHFRDQSNQTKAPIPTPSHVWSREARQVMTSHQPRTLRPPAG